MFQLKTLAAYPCDSCDNCDSSPPAVATVATVATPREAGKGDLSQLSQLSQGFGAPEIEAPPLTPEQLVARVDVLSRLADHPAIKRAFVSRWEGDVMIVTLGVRGVGTCELWISGERLKTPADYAALAACLEVEGSA